MSAEDLIVIRKKDLDYWRNNYWTSKEELNKLPTINLTEIAKKKNRDSIKREGCEGVCLKCDLWEHCSTFQEISTRDDFLKEIEKA